MYRNFETTLGHIAYGLVGLLALGGCSAPEPASELSGDAQCTPRGHWLAQEERIGGDCAPERVPEESLVIELDERDMTEDDNLWRFQVIRGDETFSACSGVPSDDHCRIEITCSTEADERRLEYALTLELNPTNALEGSGVLEVPYDVDETCQARFSLDGEQVSPLQLDSKQ